MNTPDDSAAHESSVKSFIVIDDPVSSANVGDRLRLECVLPSFGRSPPRFGRPHNWDMFEGFVLAVTFTTNDTHQILESAVMVAPGIALSVNHVVEEHVTDLRRGRLGMICVGIASHGAQGWRVKHVTCVDGTDICILSLEYMTELPPKRTLYQSTITTRVPAPGEQLVMAGFQATERTFARYPNRPDQSLGDLFDAGCHRGITLQRPFTHRFTGHSGYAGNGARGSAMMT